MARYKYLIKKDNEGFFFGLYPNNSDSQEIVRSESYQSKEEAINAISVFKDDIKTDKDWRKSICFLKDDGTSFICWFVLNGKKYYRRKNYGYKFYREAWITRIVKHINDSIRV